jgi:hypothetical protein
VKKSLPVFYKETIARILAFEHFRNIIETQAPGHGVTCYSDHLPGIKDTSLSNKGKLSTWKLHETSDLTSIVTTLYKSGPTMSIADPLSRLVRQEHRVENLDLPVLLEMLLSELPQNPDLEKASHEIFGSWYTSNTKIEPRTMPNSQDIDTLVLNSIESPMRDGASRKTDAGKAATLTARDLRAAKRQRTPEDPTSSEPQLDGPSPSLEDQCNRTSTHPLHTTSTTLPPKPINQWPALQNPEDTPNDMSRVPPDEIRDNLPKDLIVLRDDKARHRILVPACQRVALTKTEHETMIHVKGNRVHHELSRLYYWT